MIQNYSNRLASQFRKRVWRYSQNVVVFVWNEIIRNPEKYDSNLWVMTAEEINNSQSRFFKSFEKHPLKALKSINRWLIKREKQFPLMSIKIKK